jgi:hypothetical protein
MRRFVPASERYSPLCGRHAKTICPGAAFLRWAISFTTGEARRTLEQFRNGCKPKRGLVVVFSEGKPLLAIFCQTTVTAELF